MGKGILEMGLLCSALIPEKDPPALQQETSERQTSSRGKNGLGWAVRPEDSSTLTKLLLPSSASQLPLASHDVCTERVRTVLSLRVVFFNMNDEHNDSLFSDLGCCELGSCEAEPLVVCFAVPPGTVTSLPAFFSNCDLSPPENASSRESRQQALSIVFVSYKALDYARRKLSIQTCADFWNLSL